MPETPTQPPAGPPSTRPLLARPVRGRAIGGVAAGLAEHLRLQVGLVRFVFVLLVGVGGAGVAAYVFLWGFLPESDGPPRPSSGAVRGNADRGARRVIGQASSYDAMGRSGWLLVAGAAIIAVGVAAALGVKVDVGFWLPVLLLAVGAVFVWAQLDGNLSQTSYAVNGSGRGWAVARVLAGVALAITGLVLLSTRGQGLAQVATTVIPVLVVLLGLVFIMTPYAARLWRELRSEQAARVRATERADIAAHLHDSVLQTLTLIQRQSDDPQVIRLARGQERELRQWLIAGVGDQPATLASATSEAAHEVEDRYGMPVDLVLIGDCGLSRQRGALVAALREAMVNAAAHGQPPISAYLEVGPDTIEAFVRDRGPGFAADEVPADRQGVRESIIGRMRRHGGSATVRRLDVGTEVSLQMPLTEHMTVPTREMGHDA